jgi:hypothetical protein
MIPILVAAALAADPGLAIDAKLDDRGVATATCTVTEPPPALAADLKARLEAVGLGVEQVQEVAARGDRPRRLSITLKGGAQPFLRHEGDRAVFAGLPAPLADLPCTHVAVRVPGWIRQVEGGTQEPGAVSRARLEPGGGSIVFEPIRRHWLAENLPGLAIVAIALVGFVWFAWYARRARVMG